ncbi:efflux RND transporter periplasmic adaptor subunit [Photobacterium profundum]|uniref:efflux RND transporter periplasmic adaptor subunit n=1 Tax=Photobacterium profundum TaxID=74109 RepID=UPI003D10FEAF
MSKKFIISIVVTIFLILVAVFGFYQFKQHMIKEKLATFSLPPVSVTTVKTTSDSWTQSILSVGHVTSDKYVNITPQLSGQVMAINFESGSKVNKGDILVQLDDRLLQANLATSVANLKLAQIEYKRQKRLLKTHSTSQDAVDTALAKLTTSQADAKYIQTQIDFMKIKAPFSGVVGLREVNLGDFLQPGNTIVELQNVDKQYIDFSVPEVYLTKIKHGQQVKFKTDSYGNKEFTATITAIEPSVDSESRNLDIRAVITSKSAHLVSGMYVETSVITHDVTAVVPVPVVAVSYSLYGDTIYVIKPDSEKGNKTETASDGKTKFPIYDVERRTVNIGQRRNGWVGVTSGLKANEQVVTSNQQQLKEGVHVIINNANPFPAKNDK